MFNKKLEKRIFELECVVEGLKDRNIPLRSEIEELKGKVFELEFPLGRVLSFNTNWFASYNGYETRVELYYKTKDKKILIGAIKVNESSYNSAYKESIEKLSEDKVVIRIFHEDASKSKYFVVDIEKETAVEVNCEGKVI